MMNFHMMENIFRIKDNDSIMCGFYYINMATDIKLSEAQISKIIQSSGSFASWLDNLEKKH